MLVQTGIKVGNNGLKQPEYQRFPVILIIRNNRITNTNQTTTVSGVVKHPILVSTTVVYTTMPKLG